MARDAAVHMKIAERIGCLAGRILRQRDRGSGGRIREKAALYELRQRKALGGWESQSDGLNTEQSVGSAVVALVAVFRSGNLVTARQDGSLRVHAQRGVRAIQSPHVGSNVPSHGVAFDHCTGLDERALEAKLFEDLRTNRKLPNVHVRGLDLRS